MNPKKLNEELLAARFSLTDIASRIGCSLSTVSRVLAGQRQLQRYELVDRLIRMHAEHCGAATAKAAGGQQ